MEYKEYVIWGKPKGCQDETLLVANPGGKPITSKEDAERYAKACRTRYECTGVRIQEIGFSEKEVDGLAASFKKGVAKL